MARNRANIRTDMWASHEWRQLSTGAQWLYMYLLTDPTLSYVGIADWRPGRIAAKVGDADAQEIEHRAEELGAGRFVFVDPNTEEALIRSFLKHDGLLLNPNLWASIGKGFADASSEWLRGIVADEARRLRAESPLGFPTAKGGTVNPWASKYLATLLGTPSHTPTDTPSPGGVNRVSPTSTSTSTSTTSKEVSSPASSSTKPKEKRGTRIPEGWEPSPDDISTIAEQCPGFVWRNEHLQFVDYWISKPGKDGLKLDWGRTWRNWMRTAYRRLSPAEKQAMTTTTRKKFNDVDD